MQPGPVKPFTAADYRAMPEGPPYYQVVEGELVQSPSPGTVHQEVLGNLLFLLRHRVVDDHLGKVCLGPLDVYLSDTNVFQPDLFFLSNASLPLLREDGVHGPPDLVIEILLATTAMLDKQRKRPVYARYGVKELWLVDPVLEQIHRYDFSVASAKPVQVVKRDQKFGTPLLPGLVLSAVDVFQR